MIFREHAPAKVPWSCICTPMVFYQHVWMVKAPNNSCWPTPATPDPAEKQWWAWDTPATHSTKGLWSRELQAFSSSSMRQTCSLHKEKQLLSWNCPMDFHSCVLDSQRKQKSRHHFLVDILLCSYKTSFILFAFASIRILCDLQDSGFCNCNCFRIAFI